MYNPWWGFQTLEQAFAEGLGGGVESQSLNSSLGPCNSVPWTSHNDLTLSLLELQKYCGPYPVTAESESVFFKRSLCELYTFKYEKSCSRSQIK